MKKKVVIIKLGGSIITDKSKPYTANIQVIKRLAREIKKADVPVIIIHGQGSFAHTSAKKYGGMKGYKSLWGIAKVMRDAMEMNRIVMDELLNAKLPAISFRPNSLFFAESGKMKKNNLATVLEALEQGLIPVIYGDVILDKKWKTTIFSGETVTRHLVNFLVKNKIKIKKVVQVGVTDGAYDDEGKTIEEITASTFQNIKKHLFATKTTDVTGGMQHKVEEAIRLAKIGIPTIILNGNRKNELLHTLKGAKSKYQTKII